MIRIFCGEEGARRGEAIQSSVKEWLGELSQDPYAKEVIFMDDKSAEIGPLEKVFSALGSPSFFADQKAVILKNFNALKAAELDELIPFLEENNIEETGIFIEATTLDSRMKSIKKLKSLGEFFAFDPPKPWEIPRWIEDECARFQFKVSPSCAKFMSEFFINDTTVIHAEIEKLRLQFPDKRELDEETLVENLSGSNEGNIFEWLNQFGLRQKVEFIAELQKILNAGTHPLALLSPLYNHVVKLLQIKALHQKGLGEKEISKEIRMHEFLFKKNQMKNQAGKRNQMVLQRILIRLADIDAALKRGQYSYLPDFELALYELI